MRQAYQIYMIHGIEHSWICRLMTSFCISRIYHGNLRTKPLNLNTFRPRQNGRHFANDIFKCIFLNENVWIPIKNSLTFVPKGPINNIPILVQIMAWRRSGDKPFSKSMSVSTLTHICVTRPQWVWTAGKYWKRNTVLISHVAANALVQKQLTIIHNTDWIHSVSTHLHKIVNLSL